MEAEAGKFIGAGLATLGMIGAGLGVGNIFGNFLEGALRNPSPRAPRSATCSWAPRLWKPWASWPSCSAS
jgi:hypothetical protein